MEALYHQTNILVQETQACFDQLSKKVGEKAGEAIERQIQEKIATITSNCEKLDISVFKEPVARRQNAKTKVDQLKYDNHHLQAALRLYQHKQAQKRREEFERQELLSRRFTQNTNETDTAILIDHSIQHQNSLQNTSRRLDEMLMSGSSILENLRSQRITLKGAQRRLMDIANTLGLSNTTMRLIEKRAHEDKYVLIGGMIVTIIVIVLVIVYVA